MLSPHVGFRKTRARFNKMQGSTGIVIQPHQNSHDKACSLSSRLAKWAMLLTQYDIEHVPQKAVKGQALVDFLASRPLPEGSSLNDPLLDEAVLSIMSEIHWRMFFYRASHINQDWERVAGVGIFLIDPNGCLIPHAYTLTKPCFNNIIEYQALI